MDTKPYLILMTFAALVCAVVLYTVVEVTKPPVIPHAPVLNNRTSAAKTIPGPDGEPYQRPVARKIRQEGRTCVPGREPYCGVHLYYDGREIDYRLWMELGE